MRVAVLGPLGTYSHQAAFQRFSDSAEYIDKRTITDVFKSLSSVDFGVVPQENSIFGAVTETYDSLRTPEPGFICGETTLAVQHCLVVRDGVTLSDIDCVMSHEQALGQCQGFIAEHLPSASLKKMPSTAEAARALLSESPRHAAICSKLCVRLFQGLQVLREGIQDEKANYTRFYVIAATQKPIFDTLLDSPATPPTHTLLRISSQIIPSLSEGDAGRSPAILRRLLSALDLNIVRIDRRPATDDIPFHDVYFLEADKAAETDGSWENTVARAIDRVKTAGGAIKLLGIW